MRTFEVISMQRLMIDYRLIDCVCVINYYSIGRRSSASDAEITQRR